MGEGASEETVGFGGDDRVLAHEQAAHQKRNWVRLTFDCNDRCVFCLDSDTHDGSMRDRESVKHQILDGRKKGAERLILSGGEPTIHPDYVDFVRLGRLAGYERIQTVTNGRMFAYGDFLGRSLDAGLQEITFSIHGHNARIHDALVGVKGAFDEEVAGLRAALADGRPIVNIDVCVNRANVRHLRTMLDTFYAMGVREFDLLQIIPFGRAFDEGKDTLFYDIEEAAPHIAAALEFSRRDDVHLWMNRFPVEHLEGYEHLIQDPYKMGDEVRGRKEEFGRWLGMGDVLDCRDPERCNYCYVSRLCDHVEAGQEALTKATFDVVRLDSSWESSMPPVYGGDPASARKRLPIAGLRPPPSRTVAERVALSGARRLWISAPDLDAALAAARTLGTSAPRELELELEDDTALRQRLGEHGELGPFTVARIVVSDAAALKAWAELERPVELEVVVNTSTAAWLSEVDAWPSRVQLRVPTHDRLSASAEHDVDLAAFFADLHARSATIPVRGVPPCLAQGLPIERRRTLDLGHLTPEGQPEIFRIARRFIGEHYRVKSLRCRDCRHDADCAGLHVNYVRAHGFGAMQPVDAGT